jgi:hypothetical protein
MRGAKDVESARVSREEAGDIVSVFEHSLH